MFDTLVSNITEEMDEQEINEYLESKELKKGYKDEILSLSDRVKNGESIDKVSSDIRNNIKNEILIEIIFSDLNNTLQPFEETQFLRNIDLRKFKEYSEFIFNNTILRLSSVEQIQATIDININDLKCIVKFLNHSKLLIIIKRYSKALFVETIYDMFRLDKECANFIWQLFDDNRSELVISVMMDNSEQIKSIKGSVSMILEIFKDIIEDE